MQVSGKVPRAAVRKLRILLVGGNDLEAEQVRRLLGDSTSMEIECTHVGLLAQAEEHPEGKVADVLLLDVGRAPDRGAAALRAARIRMPTLPVVMLADEADEAAAAEVLQLGASGHLVRSELTTRNLVITLVAACRGPTGDLDRGADQALNDSLTGLPNGWLFRDRLDQALAAARRGSHALAVLQLDVDGFGSIQAAQGPEAASTLLRLVGERLRSTVSESDTVARVGNDEFALLLTHLEAEIDAARAAARVLEQLSRPFPVGSSSLVATASIGIAVSPHDGDESTRLVGDAKRAMRRARERGGARFEYHADDLNAELARRVAIEARLGDAIADGGLMLHYQPQFDLRRDRIVGAEALVRWRHPELGMLAPGEFLPVAEDRGWLEALGTWALREACHRAAGWHAQGHAGLRVSVNVAPVQLRAVGFPELVRGALEESQLRPDCLELEMTEESLVYDIEATAETFRELRQLGVRLAIDDFGTGYSALSYLKRLPVDVIKIDQSFVRDLIDHPVNATITETIVSLARGLGLATVAEGVETVEQLLALGSYGCHRMQGYLFGRAAPPEVFLDWLAEPPFRWTQGTV